VKDAALEAGNSSGGSPVSGDGRVVTLRRLLLLVFLFFVLTIPLAWLWHEWGVQRYVAFLFAIMLKLRDTVGWPFAGKGGGGLSLRFISHVPFVILVLLTPV